MSKFLTDSALDTTLQYVVDNTDTMLICTSAPATYAAAVAAQIGSAAITSAQFDAIADGDTSGRKLGVKAISAINTSGGTATHIAFVKTSASALILVNQLQTSLVLISNEPMDVNAWKIEIGDVT